MRILFLGADSGTASYRAAAMRRLGHTVRHIDPMHLLPRFPERDRWAFWTGGALINHLVTRRLLRTIAQDTYDAVWVDSGELVSPRLVRALQRHGTRVVNYNHDDPFGKRDWPRFRQYRSAVSAYDLVVVVRAPNLPEAHAAGARDVMLIHRSADEVAHRARVLTDEDWQRWGSDVVFVGTWMPERGEFMRRLVERGVPLSIFGNGWQRDTNWKNFSQAWRGPAADAEEEYVRAIQCAKICLGLLSKGNRDLHTTRSLEIPAIGSLFLAERTGEHLELYRENEEAVFWSDADECADKCLQLLQDPDRIRVIAQAGHERALANGHFNEQAISAILQRLFDDSHPVLER